ncbi:MAG: Holliday junction resolvase RuvX [Actinomycetota bacterium]|jgi:putative Holliday junction resolvase|nr:Holliday junction resolvase RuvX [Actinomycetota bacterium]
MRMLGLDMGERRIGIAISDPDGRVATPLKVLDAHVIYEPGPLRRLIEDYEVELIVVGLPLSLDGREGPQAKRVRELGARLATQIATPIEFFDERLSSTEAKRVMTEAGVSDKAKRGSIDMVAASVFLQSYLDLQRTRGEGEGL